MLRSVDSGVRARAAVSVLLAAAALALFIWGRPSRPESPAASWETLSGRAAEIDRDVDSVLARFHIEARSVSKRRIAIAKGGMVRIERRVLIPRELLPVQMNVALSAMAKRRDARAIASENTKENTVTIHLELDGWIIQTIILKQSGDRKISKPGERRIRT